MGFSTQETWGTFIVCTENIVIVNTVCNFPAMDHIHGSLLKINHFNPWQNANCCTGHRSTQNYPNIIVLNVWNVDSDLLGGVQTSFKSMPLNK